jgi:hypothetical protein
MFSEADEDSSHELDEGIYLKSSKKNNIKYI